VATETGDVDAALQEALETMSAAKAAGAIAKRFGLERNAVYARATELKAK
jgi:16S rRNA (cytidine1402-2'-O)-methyltransferase